MIAREKFAIGDRVVMTPQAINQGLWRRGRTGTVVGLGYRRRPQRVLVRVDGYKTAEPYHMDFWERAKGSKP